MKLTNAQAKLRKAGFVVVELGQFTTARKGVGVVELIRNGHSDDVATIRTRRASDHDDMQSDYCAGSFWDSIAQAIRSAEKYEAVRV